MIKKTCKSCQKRLPVTIIHADGRCTPCRAKNYVPKREKPAHANVAAIQAVAENAAESFEITPAPQAAPKPSKGKAEAQKELAARELARRRLLPFIRRFNPDYLPGWVHADICQRLEAFSQQVVEKKSPRLMLFMPPRSGKLLAHDTLVLTPRGFKRHGDLVPGDYVYHPDGRAIQVLALSTEDIADYEVEFNNGERVWCHARHEWLVTRRGMTRERVIETQKMAQQMDDSRRWTLPRASAIEFPESELPLDPYFFGLWLGDGRSSAPIISHDAKDQPAIDKCAAAIGEPTYQKPHPNTGVIYTAFTRRGVTTALRALRVFENKHIPDQYLRASVEQRLELLAGLVDSDGYVDKNSRVTFTTASPALAGTVTDLVNQLGMRAILYSFSPGDDPKSRSVFYRVVFQPTLDIPTALERKRIKRLAVRTRPTIVAIRRLNNGALGRCIQVDSPDGLYCVTRSMLPTHNSEIVSRTFPAWHLGQHPKHEIISCSYSSDLAMDFSRKVREILRDPEYHTLFETRLDRSSQSAERWLTDKAGGYVAAGVGGGITGRGAHCLIIDDPFKNREEAENATHRRKVIDWYTSTAYTRLAPGGGLLIVLTRWHDADLAGHLIKMGEQGEGDVWDVVSYPAIAVEDEKYRKKGEALHPDRYPLEALERIKKAVGPRDWAALYQQNPVPDEGAYFRREWFNYYTEAPDRTTMKVYQAWDFAIGQKESNDYTVGITIGVTADGSSYLLHMARGRWDSFEIVEQIINAAVAWSPQLVGLEKGQIEMAIGPILRRRMRERRTFFTLNELKTGRRDKEMRARPLQGRMQQGMVKFPAQTIAPWVEDVVHEMMRFPAGDNDDIVDALSWCFQMLESFSAVVPEKPKKKKSWRDNLEKYVGRSGGGKRRFMRA